MLEFSHLEVENQLVLGCLGNKSAPGLVALRLANLGRGLMPGCEAGVRAVRAWWAQLGSGDPPGHRFEPLYVFP